jgi:hypothetical protein
VVPKPPEVSKVQGYNPVVVTFKDGLEAVFYPNQI